MNPWEILEIDPCDDARAIKRAYAKKLKRTRPDEKPEEFQQLHGAYKWALKETEEIKERAEQQAVSTLEDSAGINQKAKERTSVVSGEEPEPLDGEQSLPQHTIPQVRETVVEAALQSTESNAEVQDAEVSEEEGLQREQAAPIEADSSNTVENPQEPEAGGEQLADEVESQAVSDPGRERRIEECHRVLKRVDEVLQNFRLIGDEKTWRFLIETPYMLDEEYNWNLGFSIFERFAQFNQQAAENDPKGKKRAQVTSNVLQYCNSLFDWSGNASHLYSALDESLCDSIFNSLQTDVPVVDPTQGLRGGRKVVREKIVEPVEVYDQYYFGSLLARVIAVLLDLLLIYVVVGFISSIVLMKVYDIPEATATAIALGICCLVYLLMAWIAESSRFQATPGKFLMGYRVANKQFERLSYARGLWRIASFVLLLPLGKVAWLINCFLGGNLMHDRLSSSHVINMRKSREEYLRRLNGE